MAENENALEEWQSRVKGGRGVARWDDEGVLLIDRIEGGSAFFISPDRRRRNQQLYRDKRDDDFTNGAFFMLACVDSDGESKAMFAKQNAPDDAELLKLLEANESTFNKKVKAMTEPVTVERLYRLARANESGKKIKVAGDRLKQLDPHAVLVGDQLAKGNENPDDQRDGPAATVDVDRESTPIQYADAP